MGPADAEPRWTIGVQACAVAAIAAIGSADRCIYSYHELRVAPTIFLRQARPTDRLDAHEVISSLQFQHHDVDDSNAGNFGPSPHAARGRVSSPIAQSIARALASFQYDSGISASNTI
jgi:hypothetical protein